MAKRSLYDHLRAFGGRKGSQANQTTDDIDDSNDVIDDGAPIDGNEVDAAPEEGHEVDLSEGDNEQPLVTDDADPDEMSCSEEVRRERARCAAIFQSPSAAANPGLAARLAFHSDLSAKAIIGLLGESAAAETPRPSSLNERMAGLIGVRVSAASQPSVSRQAAVDLSWEQAAKRAGLPLKHN